MTIHLEHLYRWSDIAPGWVNRLDDRFAFTFNQLIYAITAVKKDIARLDEEFACTDR